MFLYIQKKHKVLGDLLWDEGRGEGSPMHFCLFILVCVLFFAESK